MPKYLVRVESMAPTYHIAELEIEAENEDEAEEKVDKLYEEDEIDWTKVETDYDEAELEILSVQEIKEENHA